MTRLFLSIALMAAFFLSPGSDNRRRVLLETRSPASSQSCAMLARREPESLSKILVALAAL